MRKRGQPWRTCKIGGSSDRKQELTKVIQYMERKLLREGVEIRLNCEVTEELLQKEFAGHEVIAGTGSDPIVVNAFTAFKHCVTADDILAGKAFAGRKVVVIGGGSVGCETADYLAPLVNDLFPRNREIVLLEMADGIMLQESGPGQKPSDTAHDEKRNPDSL